MFLAQNDTFRKMFEHFWHFEGGLFLSINNPFVLPINYPHLCSTKTIYQLLNTTDYEKVIFCIADNSHSSIVFRL